MESPIIPISLLLIAALLFTAPPVAGVWLFCGIALVALSLVSRRP